MRILLLITVFSSYAMANRLIFSEPKAWYFPVRLNTNANVPNYGFQRQYQIAVRNISSTAQNVSVRINLSNIQFSGLPTPASFQAYLDLSPFTGTASSTKTLNLAAAGSAGDLQYTVFDLLYKGNNVTPVGNQVYYVAGSSGLAFDVSQDSGAVIASITEFMHFSGGTAYARDPGPLSDDSYNNLLSAIFGGIPNHLLVNQGRPF